MGLEKKIFKDLIHFHNKPKESGSLTQGHEFLNFDRGFH